MLRKATLWFFDKAGGVCVGAALTGVIQLGVLTFLREWAIAYPLLAPVLAAAAITAVLGVIAWNVAKVSPGVPAILYAGWGKGPTERDLVDVTEILQGYINAHVRDLKASDVYFTSHYAGDPRILLIRYRIGNRNALRTFKEHDPVRLE